MLPRSASNRLATPLSATTRQARCSPAKPFRYLRSEIVHLEQTADLPSGDIGDYHRVWLGQSLQASRQVGCFTNHRLLLRRARAEQITDNDEPRRDADAQLQPLAQIEKRHRIDERKPGAHGSFGVILMRVRVPEIRENAVTHVFGDKPVKPRQHRGDGFVIGADDITQILGVEPCCKLRRADEITEHYSERAAFGRGLS